MSLELYWVRNYENKYPSILPKLAEWHVYGNEQQGRFLTKFPEVEPTYYGVEIAEDVKNSIFSRQLGKKAYELKDHLGNVRVTFSDIKMPTGSGTQPFGVDLLSTNQYYPYGMVIEDLSWNTGDIRYGFGGTHEMDNEIKGGVGKHLSFGDFGYDTRVARRFNLDPIDQIFISNYAAFGSNPIYYTDPSGYNKTPCDNCPDVNPKAGGGKDLGTNILNGAKNSLIVLGGIVNSIVSNSFTFSDKNIVNLDNFKVSDETKHYFKVGEEEGHKLTITIAAFETAVGIYEEATGTFFLPFTEGVSGLVIAKGYLLNAHGVFASTNAIIKLQNMNSVGNTSGGGGGNSKDIEPPPGWKHDPSAGLSMGQKIYKKGNRYITRDVGNKGGTTHNGGVWKELKKSGNKFILWKTLDKDLKVLKVYK